MGALNGRAVLTMIRNADWARTLLYAVPPGLMAMEVGWCGYAITVAGMILARKHLDAIVLRRRPGRG